jgi:peptide/nickel transport system substrate-binding protein
MNRDQQVEQFVTFVRTHVGHQISRREFLQRGLALGLSLPAAIGVLAACGAAPAAPATVTPPTAGPAPAAAATAPTIEPTPAAQRPAKGGFGTMVTVAGGDLKSFNPDSQIDQFAWEAQNAIYSMLITLDWDYNIVGDLAQRWTTSNDGLRLTFELHDNARWHDGKPVTAADVKWTFEKIAAEKTAFASQYLDTLDHIETPDDTTAIFVLKQPAAPLLGFLAWYATFVMPKHIYDGTDWATNPANQKPIGSGPFKFVEHKPGELTRLEKNLDYYGEGPYLDALVIRIIPDSSTALQAFRNGEVDSLVFFTPPLAEVPALEKDPAAKVVRYTYPSIYYLGCNLVRKPLSDRKVRQALAMGIDRQEIVDRALNGFGTAESHFYTPAIAWALNQEARAPDYDLQGAMHLLDEAGFPLGQDGTRMKLVFPYPNLGDEWRNIAQVVQAQLKALGVAVDLVELEAAAWQERVGKQGDFDLSLLDGSHGPDPANLRSRYASDGTLQFWHYSNAKVDQLLAAAERLTTQPKRAEKYRQVQALLADDLPTIPLCNQVSPLVYSAKLAGMPLAEGRGKVGQFNYSMVKVIG